MIEQAVPPGVKANVVPINKMIEVSKDPRFGGMRALLLFETPQDVVRVLEGGMDLKEVNLGSIAHSTGKVVVTRAVAMDNSDLEALETIKNMGVSVDVRKVPADSSENFDNMLKKAKDELAKIGEKINIVTILLIVFIAFLAGMEGILDQFQFHQPLVACTLFGLVSGHLEEGIILGGSLQLMALGWANVGAAVAPDAALASVASAIIMVLGLQGGNVASKDVITTSIAVAVPLSVAGLFLTMMARILAIPLVHLMDSNAEKGNIRCVEMWNILAIVMQVVRIAIPAPALCIVPSELVTETLNKMPAVIQGGMAIGGGMVAAVGCAMVINMMATKETWPFFVLGFIFAIITQLTLISLGAIGVSIALIYLGLKENSGGGNGDGGSGNTLGDILNDY